MVTKRHIVMRRGRGRLLTIAVGMGALVATSAIAANFGPWSTPVPAEVDRNGPLNTEFNDGCPILSPDGLSLYMATNRPGGLGKIDIWVAHRPNTRAAWGAPVPLPAPVNSPEDDFCPTPVRGKQLYFVSRRSEPNGDIYHTRLGPDGWRQPIHLGPNVNSPDQEWSPAFFIDDRGREVLYFSSTRPGGPGPAGNQNIWFSVNGRPAELAPGLNTEFDDARPNVRRDGLEIVFDSTRPGSLGGPDVWSATRSSTRAPWSAPVHHPELSSAAPDTRASLSWDGTFLLVGSGRSGGEGQADIYVSTRQKARGAR